MLRRFLMSNLCTCLSEPAHKTKRLRDSKRVLCKLFFSLLLLLACSTNSFAATAAGYSEYYVPGGENEMSLALRSIGTPLYAAEVNMEALISITAWSDNITIYYDHWEDGIDFDPDNPAATADEIFTLATTGTLLTLDNTPVGGIVIPRNSANTYYDGGDRIYVAGGAVTVTRVSWRYDVAGFGRSVQAVAWEIYPVKPQLTTYVIPFGENLSGSFPDFLRTYVIVQATANNTTFTVDLDGNGTPDPLDQNFDGDTADPGDTSTVTLQAGQSFFIGNVPVNPVPMPRGALATINSGAIIQGSSTLQVKFIVGDPTVNFETRGISAFPRGYWTKDYYAPVGDSAARITDIFLYNPHTTAITVNWETQAGSGNFAVGAGATVSYVALAGQLPVGGGVYLRGSDVFWGVSMIDSTGPTNEWAYSLLPSTLLYSEHFLGWAPGGADGNDSGVFLTVVQDNTTVFVDTDNDGTANQTYTLNRLQTQYITDPTDFDLSGTRFWATGPFTMSYGQNPDTAPAQATSGDLGYVAIPSADFISLVLTVDKSVSPQVVPAALGSTATFTLTVNSQKYTVDGIAVTDYLPANWAFVNDSAEITLPDLTQVSGTAANPTITGTGPYTLDWPGSLLGNMAENQEILITFIAQTTAALPSGTLSQNRVKAVGTRTFGTPSQTQTFTTTDFAYVVSGGPTITKTSGAADPVSPGDTIPYTVTVANPASAAANLTGVSIYDPLPAGTSYVAGSGSVTCNRPSVNVRDEFASAAYNLNGPNNTANWSGDWTETDIQGTTAGATAGFVWITGGVLQFRFQTATYIDNLDTGFYNLSNGTNLWTSSPWTETGDDGSATTGTIMVDNGGSNELRFGPGAVGRSVTRTAAVTGDSVSVNFSLFDRGIGTGEGVIAEYDIDGDAFGFREIRRITNGALSFAFSPVCAALPCTLNTTGATYITLRFRDFDTVNGTYEAGDFAGVDTVNITVNNAVGSRIQRTADLSGASSASLNFTYASANLDAGTDILVVEASSSPAGPFTTLATFNAGVPNVAPPYNIAAYISATTTIRFRITGGFNATNETLSIDNVDITFSGTGAFASGNPPDFLPSSAGCVIAPGSLLTLTFNVTVDDPFPSGQTIITNTASTSSVQIPMAVSASATNTVLVPSSLSASTGGRIWLDADADGTQDIGEPGIPNVEVTLKDQFGTTIATTLTDGNGRYLFIGVIPGTGYYIEVTDGLSAGLTQTYPYTSTPGDLTNNRTTTFTLVDGQVYTSGNIGYRAAAGTASFGDQVWADADSDGVRDPGEVGIGGVAVRLYLDNNGDGVIDGGDTLVSSTTSAPDGTYLFTGATATGSEDYLVSVTTPAGYLATGATQFRYIDVTAGSTLLFADFGFIGDTITTYTIQDRVWTDTDGDGIFDAGENGLAGVTIELLDASLNVIGTTITSADGTFIFSGVTGGGADYTVRINDTGGVLLDYYGTTSYSLALQRAESNLSGSVDHTTASPFGSFGFRPLRSIGDTVFNDLNGNGVQDSGEPGIAGVVVSLYRNNAPLGTFDGSDTLISTVTTDASGQYLFSGLADAEYIVSVPVPAGYSFIPNGVINPDMDGTPANGIQNRSAIAGGVNDLDKDFGFQATTPRTVSGTVWEDLDADGVIDGGEGGLGGVTLDILSGSTVVGTVTTNASGVYTLPGLASGIYTVRITDTSGILTNYEPTFEYGVGTGGPFDNQAPVDLTGGSIATVHFGFKKPTPTLVTLSDFSAYKDSDTFIVQWSTSSEMDTIGFYLFRLDERSGKYRQINQSLLPGLITSAQGGTYTLIDNGASLTGSNTYLLMEVESRGGKHTYGPFTVAAGSGNALENQYGSSARSAEAFLSKLGSSSGSDAKKVRRYIDHKGTAVISNSSSMSSLGAPSQVSDEVSDYKRTAKAISVKKQAALSVRAEEIAGAGILNRQRTGSMAKISVTKDGLYYIDAAEISQLLGMTDAKIRQLIGSGNLTLSNQGNAVAYIATEDMAGLFFYGQGIDSQFTKENIYWLFQGRGLQMGSMDGADPAAVGYSTFTETIHAEEDKVVAPVLARGPASDYWFWDYVIAGNPSLGTRLFDLEVHGVADIPPDAGLTIQLHGLTATGTTNDHHVIISLNNTVIGEDQWKGAEKRIINLSLGQGLLHSGTNQIKVQGLLDTGAPYSVFFVDSFDLTYQRLLEAHEDSVTFMATDALPLTVYGFTGPDLVAFDITDPNKPTLNMATTIDMAGGNYSVSFIPSPGSRYLVTASDAAAVANAWADRPSSLKSGNNQADYIIITTKELVTAARELAGYRQKQGLASMVVDLEDIMDEFNYGISSPEAIHDFLAHAYAKWKTAPKYVLLAGDGTYDYRDNMGIGDNLVPTLMAETPWFITPSDNLFADMDGDHLPDIAIGRLPVLTSEELGSVIKKIITYEATAGNRVIMLADNQDDGGNFPSDSDDLTALLPTGYSVEKIYLSLHTPAEARQLLFNEIQTGAVLLNYTGHAGTDTLAAEGLLRVSDVAALQNSRKPFVLAAMTCSVGNFALPGYNSLSEALVTKDSGGAAAVWAPAGLSYNYLSKSLNGQFFRSLLPAQQFFRVGHQDKRVTLGNVIVQAFRNYQITGGPAYIMDIYNLQGDPALRLW